MNNSFYDRQLRQLADALGAAPSALRKRQGLNIGVFLKADEIEDPRVLEDGTPVPPAEAHVTWDREGAKFGATFADFRSVLRYMLVQLSNLSAPKLQPVHTRYAVAVLEQDEETFDDEAIATLAKKIRRPVSDLAEAVARKVEDSAGGFPTTVSDLEGFDQNGMMLADAALTDQLEQIGNEGAKAAEILREGAKDRWAKFHSQDVTSAELFRLWMPRGNLIKNDDPNRHVGDDVPPPAKYPREGRKGLSIPAHTEIMRAVFNLTRAVWLDVARPRWKRLRDNRPAIVRSVHDGLEEMAFRDGRTVRELDGPQLQLWDDGNELVAQTPTLPEQQLARVVEQGTEEFRSITGVRLLVHVIRTTHMQFYRDADDPRVVEIEGGIKELSRQIGDPGSGKSQDRLKKILEAGNHWRREWNGVVERGLWTWSVDDRTGPGQRSHVRIIVGDPLSPQFVHQMPKGERTLVPIVDIAPLVNPGRYYGPQAAFQQALVRKIVERRKHIPERGGAALSLTDDLWPIAGRLNLPQSTMKRALDRWTSDGDDGPQFLDLVAGRLEGKAVYHLADNDKYRRAREFIAETARRSKRASKAGKASANKRKNR